jgi:hypothetical protein
MILTASSLTKISVLPLRRHPKSLPQAAYTRRHRNVCSLSGHDRGQRSLQGNPYSARSLCTNTSQSPSSSMSLLLFICMSLTQISFQRLDFPIDPVYRPRHVKTLIKLSRACRLYPISLVIKGIEIEAQPIDKGSFGDIYKGRLLGKEIVIKVLRVYQTSDMDKLLKVMKNICFQY